MPRQRKGISLRKSQKRDAKTFFIIATEGAKTERIYFNGIDEVTSPKVNIEVLEKEASASSPEDCLKVLDEYAKEYVLVEGDELWVVIDKDQWTNKQIGNIAQACQQKESYFMALSNPCFEIWFLLHFADVVTFSNERKKKLLENAKVNKSRTYVEKELMDVLGSYNKTNPDIDACLPYLSEAIARAKKLDIDKKARWMNTLGTRVYLLMEKLTAE